jgi:protein-tyrosine phosphatase
VIDTHCHLLSGLDDGPRSFNDSIRMARRLVANGVIHAVCTPHFNRRFPTPHEAATAAHLRLAEALASLDIHLTTSLAAELSADSAASASERQVLDRRLAPGYVLVELEPATLPHEIFAVEKRLARLGLHAVLAHPERCRAVERDPELLDGPRERGALVQVVSPSLGGEARSDVGRTAWSLIGSDRADLVASDAHRPDGTRLELGALREVIAARAGAARATELLVDAPARLLGIDVSGS